METTIASPLEEQFGIGEEAMNKIQTAVFPEIIKDSKLYDRFLADPLKFLAEYGIKIPTGFKVNPIVPEDKVYNLQLPYRDTVEKLQELNNGLANFADAAGEPYVQVEAKWWGLVWILSDQACKDLVAGGSAAAGVSAAIAAVLAATGGGAAAALLPGLIAAVLGIAAGIMTLINRGNGIYITALWTVIHLPAMWVPTTR